VKEKNLEKKERQDNLKEKTMANIGRVYRDSYYNKGLQKDVGTIVLDIRTISTRKKFNISVNKFKYEDGNVNGAPAQGKEEHPDYHIWANFSNRGESIPSQIVGSVKDAVSENGLKYKRASLFDPFTSKESIYFTLFTPDAEKKIDENHLYDVVAQPFRKLDTNTQEQGGQAQPSYGEPQQSYKKEDGSTIPITTEPIEVDEDEIPF